MFRPNFSRRVHARYKCRFPSRVGSDPRKPLEAEIIDISMGGVLLMTRAPIDSGWMPLEIVVGKQALLVEAKVVHSSTRDPKDPELKHYGMMFRLNENSETRLKVILDNVRGGQSYGPNMGKDYWQR